VADNIVEILLKFGLERSKADEAAKVIENVRKEVNKAGSDVEAYNKRLEQMAKLQDANKKAGGDMADTYADLRKKVEEANFAGQQEDETVKKKFASYNDLKAGVKGAAAMFPGLAHAARIALNPITLSVAAIAGAFKLWETKKAQLTQSLGGIDMANVGESDLQRINRFKDAWEGVATAMAKAATQSATIRKDFDASMKIIEGNDRLAKAMGLDTGTSAAEEKRGLALSAADVMEASARGRLGRAGTPGSAVSEGNVQDAFDRAIEKAIADKTETQGRIDWLLEMKESGVLGQMMKSPQFVTRYGYPNGLFSTPGADIESALEMERGNLASQQGIIDAGKRFGLNRVSRGVARGEISGANADLEAAAAMRGQAAGFQQDIAVGTGGEFKTMTDSAALKMASGNIQSLIEGVLELAAATQKAAQARKQMDQATKELQAEVEAMKQRP
jgi:hypothetical protein